MKAGWNAVALGQVCRVYQPVTLAQKDLRPGPYPVFGANGQIGTHDEYNHAEPQLVLGCRGSCGTVHTTPPKAWINGNAMVVVPSAQIDRSFLAYALLGGIDISGAITGSAQPQITRKSLAPVEIRYPPRQEQRRIVGILDEAFEGIARAKASAKKNLENGREVLKATRREVFEKLDDSWHVLRLEDLAENLDSKRVPIKKSVRKPGPYPYYGASGIVDHVANFIFDEETLLISEDGANLLSRATPIAFPVRGKYWVNNHAHVLRFSSSLVQRIVEEYIEGISIDEYVTGAAQPKLTQKALNSIPIPMPRGEARQAEIVALLDAIGDASARLRLVYEQKLTALDELEKSLLHHAFTGAL